MTAAYKPTRNAFTAAIKAMGKRGEQAQALDTFDDMIVAGIRPDRWGFATVISSCCESGDVKKAELYLMEMAVHNVKPDAAIYTSLMKGYSRVRNLQKVLEVRDDLDEAGLMTDEYTVCTIVDAYVKCGLVEEAKRLVGPGGRYAGLASPQVLTALMKVG